MACFEDRVRRFHAASACGWIMALTKGRQSRQDNLAKPTPLGRVLAPVRGLLMGALGCAALGSMLTMVPLAGMAYLGQVWIESSGLSIVDKPAPGLVVGVSVLSLVLGMLLISLAELIAHLADGRCSHALRLTVAQRLMRVPLGWFTERTSGEIKQVLQDDVATLHGLTAHGLTAVARAVGAIAVVMAYLLVLDWRMTLVVMLPFVGFFGFLRQALRAGQANMASLMARMTRINSATMELVRAAPVIKAFGGVGQAHQGFLQAVDAFAAAFERFVRPLVRAMAHAHALVSPVTLLAIVLVTGLVWVHFGWLRLADILPFVLLVPGLAAPLLLLHTLVHALDNAKAAAQRVVSALDAPVLHTLEPIHTGPVASATIEFDNVSLTYANGHVALRDVSLTLPAGRVTAIVGPSGAGKSTLARLLLRFFDPDQGRITYGGVDIRRFEGSQLYQHVGFVLQEVQLIHASVRDNLTLGRPAATEQEIEQVARAAQMHDHIMSLPRGYDSVVGEDAVFSGGERQRLSIARALLLDPPVLVLDEATAAVDARNEAAIQAALASFMPGRTLMVIAHRLDTVRHADKICVLDAGELVETGTHAQLLEQNGCYARLWRCGGYDQGESNLMTTQAAASC